MKLHTNKDAGLTYLLIETFAKDRSVKASIMRTVSTAARSRGPIKLRIGSFGRMGGSNTIQLFHTTPPAHGIEANCTIKRQLAWWSKTTRYAYHSHENQTNNQRYTIRCSLNEICTPPETSCAYIRPTVPHAGYRKVQAWKRPAGAPA